MFYLNNCDVKDLTKEVDNFFKNGLFGNNIKADLEENDKNYLLTVDAPGVDKKDISISFEDGYLTVSFTSKTEKNEKKKYIVRERGFSEVSRSFYLEDADENTIKAKLADGVLTVEIAKMPKVETKKIISIE